MVFPLSRWERVGVRAGRWEGCANVHGAAHVRYARVSSGEDAKSGAGIYLNLPLWGSTLNLPPSGRD